MTQTSPAKALAQGQVLSMPARVRHTRLGALRRAFGYRADYLLFAPEAVSSGRGLLRRNGFGLLSLNDRDHGGPPKAGRGAEWAAAQFAAAGFARQQGQVLGLLTQPRILGFGFNPVSFWLLWQGDALIAYIAEVSNTWGQRHSYLCRNGGDGAKTASKVAKVFHVSPFQDVQGHYHFRLTIAADYADILICHHSPKAGLVARMQGPLRPLRQRDLLAAAILRPGGALRILGLIYAQALRLKLRGALWRPLPPLPTSEISE